MADRVLETNPRGALGLRRALPALALLAVGASCTALAHRAVREREEAAARLEFEARADEATTSIFGEFSIPLEVALSVPAFVAAHPTLDAAAFERFVTPALARHSSIGALEWAPRVRHAERAAFEGRLGKSIVEPRPDGGMSAAPPRSDYYPLEFMAPLYPPVLGLDVGFETGRRLVVDSAVARGEPICSPRFRLVEDPPGVHSIALYVPAFDGEVPSDPERRRAQVKGLGITLFRINPVVQEALEGHSLRGLGFRLEQEGSSEEGLLYEAPLELPGSVAAYEWSKSQELLGRRWLVRWRGDPRVFTAGARATNAAVVGALLTLLAAGGALSWALLGRLRRQVDAARRVGSYTLVARLGEGGMGVVYLARHALLRRPTAIKLVRAEAEKPSAVARFEREVQFTSQLTHPNTIQIYDYGRTPEGVFYYAMEYLEGITLEELVERTGPLPPARVVYLLEQMAGSLAEAHARGIVHRDLKPENVMVCERGGLSDFVKVLDFGLVKRWEKVENTGLSQASSLVGTPAYMAPEAMTDPLGVTPAADVYALGGVAYFLLTGRPVFESASLVGLMSQALTRPVMHPSKRLGASLPESLCALVLACLQKEPTQRPEDAGRLLERLAALPPLGAWGQAEAIAWWEDAGRRLCEERVERCRSSLATDHAIAVDWDLRGTGTGSRRSGGSIPGPELELAAAKGAPEAADADEVSRELPIPGGEAGGSRRVG